MHDVHVCKCASQGACGRWCVSEFCDYLSYPTLLETISCLSGYHFDVHMKGCFGNCGRILNPDYHLDEVHPPHTLRVIF
jgi:hypothetical protein